MTLKTSLIITGDSAAAKAAVDALTDSVNKLGKAGSDTATPANAMGTALDGAGNSAREAANDFGALDGAIGGVADTAADLADKGSALGGAMGDIGGSARGAANDASALDGALGRIVGSIGDTAGKALGLDGALSTVGSSAKDTSSKASDLEGTLGDLAQGALSSATAQGAIAKASGVAATAMAGLGVSAGTVEAVLTGGLSLALPIVIGFLSGFAAEALSGADALGQEEEAAASLTEQIDALNKALERETQTQYSSRVATLAHAESKRILAADAIKARKALLETALVEQRNQDDPALAANDQQRRYLESNIDKSAQRVRDLQSQIKGAEKDLAAAENAVAGSRRYFVDRGIAAATDPRARAQLTYDQGLDRLDRRRGQLSEAQYAREKAQLDRDRAAAIDALSQSEGRAAGSTRKLSGARSAASAADREAADAARKLQSDLEGVIGRYDPAAKAASDYADELERIARLAKAGKISTDDAAKYRSQASAAYLGKAIDWTGIKGAAGDEQATMDAAAAIDKLVQSIREEGTALAALDPIQRASIKYRKELATLPAGERAAAAQRIADAQAEADANKAVADAAEDARRAQEQLGNMAIDAFAAIVTGGQKADRVISRLAETIAAAAIQATLFGTGPLAAMLGGAALPRGGGAAAQAQGAAADLVGKSVGKSVEGAMDKAFDAKGKFATVLKNAGLGYAAGGATGSRTGGAIGGAIGGEVGKELLGSALGKLGNFAGPIGAIAGGLLGGVVGGLLKKTKTGAANITSVDGAASISGNSSQFKAAASGAASNVQDGLASIAERLGGSVGGFNVTIGQRHGDWRVREGAGSLKIKKGATEFDDDQAGAIAYAIQLAVSQGAVTGLSGAVQQALKSSPDLDKALTEALKVQEVETLLGGLGDELAQQFKGLETQAKERLRIARQYGFDVVAIEKKNAEDRAKLVDQLLKDRVGSLQSLLDDMNFGNLAEGSAMDQRTKLIAEIAKARSDAEAGVDGAADKLASLSRSLIDLSRDKLGTAGNEYAADRATTTSAAQAVIAAEKSRIAAASGEQAATNAKLDETNKTLDELAEQQSQANGTLDQILQAITKQGIPVATGGGSSMVRGLYDRQQEL